MNIKNILIISVVTFLVLATLYFKFNLDKQKEIVNKYNDSLVISKQNTEAYKNMYEMRNSDVQDYAIFVDDLSKQLNNKTSKYDILSNKYKLLLDTVKILQTTGTIINQGDSIYIATLKGYNKPYTYNGVVNYFTKLKTYSYDLSIYSDPIYIESYVYLDSNNIIKNKIKTNNGVIDSAKIIIDKNIYLAINRSKVYEIPKKSFLDRIHIPLSFEYTKEHDINTYIGISFEIFDNTNIYIKNVNYNLDRNVQCLGVEFSPTIRKFFVQ